MQSPEVTVLAAYGGTAVCSTNAQLAVGSHALPSQGRPTCAAFSPDGGVLAVGVDPKTLLLLARIDGGTYRTARTVNLPKRVSAVCFAPGGKAALVADRFGDVREVPTDGLPAGPAEPDEVTIGDGEEDAPPLLGHFCTVTDVAARGALVATGDRERRARLSCYPRAVDVRAFCLGHTAYVTRVALCGERLVTGGGDGFVRCWGEDGEEAGGVEVGGVVLAVGWAEVLDLCVVGVVGEGKVWGVRGVESGRLEVGWVMEVGGEVSNVVVDGACVWVSVSGSGALKRYRLGGGAEAVQMTAEEVRATEEEVPVPAVEPREGVEDWSLGGWLSSLGKPVYDPDWKGKGRKRRRHAQVVGGGEEGDGEEGDEGKDGEGGDE